MLRPSARFCGMALTAALGSLIALPAKADNASPDTPPANLAADPSPPPPSAAEGVAGGESQSAPAPPEKPVAAAGPTGPAASAPEPKPGEASPTGQSVAAPQPELEKRLRDLEEIVRKQQELILKLQEEQKAAGKPPLPPSEIEKIVADKLKKEQPQVGYSAKDGFFLQTPDKNLQLRLRGLLQTQSRFSPFEQGSTGTDSFFLRRVRPMLEGTLYKYFDFRFMPDFGVGAAVIQDAYLDIRYRPEAQLKVGKQKVPLNIDNLKSDQNGSFVERAISVKLTPDREVGYQLHGDLFGGRVNYAVEAYNGNFDGASSDGDADNGKDLAARLFFQPFIKNTNSPLQGLGFGLAGSFGEQGGPLKALAYKTNSRSTYFSYLPAVTENGTNRHLDPQAYYFYGPFGVMGEYISSHQNVVNGGKKAGLTHNAWFAQGTYVLTGEKASYNGVVPRKNFDPAKGQWGAFELAGRYSQVRIDPDAFSGGFADPALSAGSAKAFTLGLNWYFNPSVKLQFNWEYTKFDRKIPYGATKTDHEGVFLTQLQVYF